MFKYTHAFYVHMTYTKLNYAYVYTVHMYGKQYAYIHTLKKSVGMHTTAV